MGARAQSSLRDPVQGSLIVNIFLRKHGHTLSRKHNLIIDIKHSWRGCSTYTYIQYHTFTTMGSTPSRTGSVCIRRYGLTFGAVYTICNTVNLLKYMQPLPVVLPTTTPWGTWTYPPSPPAENNNNK